MSEHISQLPADLAQYYDAHYYRTYAGAPYERSAFWLTAFAGVADGVVREIAPRSVLDVGCAMGLLVEALRDRGVEAFGVDVSSYAIAKVRDDIRPYCWLGSAVDPLSRRYDLIVCQEVLEHLAPADAERAVERLCGATDDILFSSTPYGYAEDTHVNVRPLEYWATLFAQQGFVRDVDFSGSGYLPPWAMRVRRSVQPQARVIGDYERRMWALQLENSALRGRVLETKAVLAQQDEARPAAQEMLALQRTVAEQREHLDALGERIRYMSDREVQLRTMLHAAHAHLLARDEQLRAFAAGAAPAAAAGEDLHQVIADRTAWAERMVSEAEQRGAIIEEQQAAIAELHRVIAERTAWAERMVAEAEARGRIIDELSNRGAGGAGLLQRIRRRL